MYFLLQAENLGKNPLYLMLTVTLSVQLLCYQLLLLQMRGFYHRINSSWKYGAFFLIPFPHMTVLFNKCKRSEDYQHLISGESRSCTEYSLCVINDTVSSYMGNGLSRFRHYSMGRIKCRNHNETTTISVIP